MLQPLRCNDFFTGKPDYSPYNLVMPSKSVFDPQEAMKRYNRNN